MNSRPPPPGSRWTPRPPTRPREELREVRLARLTVQHPAAA
ncbi:hypothetical protein ACODT3_39230 [Streptomyces sp. 4.24]